MEKLHVKSGDTVVVLSGESKGVKGKVIAASPEEGKVIVEGANIVSKHTKARRQGDKSQIIKTEAAMYASKVSLYCPKCDKAVRTHVEIVDGKKVRVCSGKRNGQSCGYKFD